MSPVCTWPWKRLQKPSSYPSNSRNSSQEVAKPGQVSCSMDLLIQVRAISRKQSRLKQTQPSSLSVLAISSASGKETVRGSCTACSKLLEKTNQLSSSWTSLTLFFQHVLILNRIRSTDSQINSCKRWTAWVGIRLVSSFWGRRMPHGDSIPPWVVGSRRRYTSVFPICPLGSGFLKSV